jgi:short-subunit dehydrogenase
MSGIEVLPLDVRSDESVEACLNTLLKKTGRLDILVNNAGYVLRGAIEEPTLEEVKAQFETNLFGVVRMIKGVLPIMRRQGSGQIINISSGVGLVPSPFMGFYAASKFALEGYTEALRHEVKPFNVQVSLVEPGFIKTHVWQNMKEASGRISDYDPWRERALKVRHQFEEKHLSQQWWPKLFCALSKANRRGCATQSVVMWSKSPGCGDSYQKQCLKRE